MSKVIKLRDVARINNLYLEIFEEEDNDYVDRRKTSPRYKTIDRILENITKDKEEQKKIYEAITKETFNSLDYSYKPMCDNLRGLGYVIGKEAKNEL